MNIRTRAISDPGVMMGDLAIAGTRITGEYIIEKRTADESVGQILRNVW